MQPLSRVRPSASTFWGQQDTMARRPSLALKIAECIAEWAEIETTLGMFLGLLLHANPQSALAMWSSVENRTSQMRMLDAAAESQLPADHYDIIAVLQTAYIRPAMKERDKLAHWCWGYSEDLPDALILAEPSTKMAHHFRAIHIAKSGAGRAVVQVPDDSTSAYVVTEGDLTRTLNRLRNT